MGELIQFPGLSRLPLFPVSEEVVLQSAEIFGRFNDEEIDLILDGNLDLLSPNDPVRYLLEPGARPSLHKEMPTEHEAAALRAYRLGVCVGAAIMRKHLDTRTNQGHDLPEIVFDPKQGPTYDDSRFTQFGRLVLPRGTRRRIADFDATNRPGQYLAKDSNVALGVLKSVMEQQGVKFMQEQHAKQEVPPFISRGVGDVFETYERLYRRAGLSPSPLQPVRPYVINKRTTADTTGPVTNILDVHQMKEALSAQPMVQTGFSYFASRPGLRRLWPHEARQSWNSNIQPNSVITHIYQFGSRVQAVNEGGSAAVQATRGRQKRTFLGKDDVVIVRDDSGELHGIEHPFKIPAELARENAVRLYGKYTYAGDYTDLRPEEARDYGSDGLRPQLYELLEYIDEQAAKRNQITQFLVNRVLPRVQDHHRVWPQICATLAAVPGFAPNETIASTGVVLSAVSIFTILASKPIRAARRPKITASVGK